MIDESESPARAGVVLNNADTASATALRLVVLEAPRFFDCSVDMAAGHTTRFCRQEVEKDGLGVLDKGELKPHRVSCLHSRDTLAILPGRSRHNH